MQIEVSLPTIQPETKQRVVSYFSKAAKKGTVIFRNYRDNLPEQIDHVGVLTFVPASKKPEDMFIDDEVIVVNVAHPKNKSAKPTITIMIQSNINKNAQGFSCGTKQETFLFDGSDWEWVSGLATGV